MPLESGFWPNNLKAKIWLVKYDKSDLKSVGLIYVNLIDP